MCAREGGFRFGARLPILLARQRRRQDDRRHVTVPAASLGVKDERPSRSRRTSGGCSSSSAELSTGHENQRYNGAAGKWCYAIGASRLPAWGVACRRGGSIRKVALWSGVMLERECVALARMQPPAKKAPRAKGKAKVARTHRHDPRHDDRRHSCAGPHRQYAPAAPSRANHACMCLPIDRACAAGGAVCSASPLHTANRVHPRKRAHICKRERTHTMISCALP